MMLQPQVSAILAGILVCLFGNTAGFLATSLNATDPDLVHILCPEQTTGITRDHKWITREAIRRNLRQFFLNFPPAHDPEIHIPEDASLTELYHAYYGDKASPARFMKAVNTIAASNVQADSSKQLRYDPSIQADGEVFDEYQFTMADRYPQIITSILLDESYPAARSLLGISLHSLQKFYSHSTWIEKGNTEILENLGLPGFLGFDDTAERMEDVCTPCGSSQGECRNNVIQDAGLTTGFYTYQDKDATEFLIDKPGTGGKCSHGGILDESSSDPAVGGINKDTASPCFSPHYYLHDQAAELAVQATDSYLSVILNAIDADRYRRLFDLYHGSALAIVLDTTSSMGSEITAVKNQVHQIVESSSAGLYVLVPFNDPNVGGVTRTTDADEFLAAVDKLSASGGGDIPEMFWSGLQLALTNTLEYGVIFCFTDAVGKDADKMEGDIAMAEQKEIKVTIVFSGADQLNAANNSQLNTPNDDTTFGIKPVESTTMEDYHNLCDMTGGLFIPSDKFDIGEITPLLEESVGSTEVDIVLVKGIKEKRDISVPIDDSIYDFKVQVVGQPTLCTLKDPQGVQYNILDETTMRDDPTIEVIAYTESIRALRWQKPSYGIWTLETEAKVGSISVTVEGNSTLSWLGGFSILDPSPPHPHYMAVEGRPLTKTIYYVDINLIGYIESDVTDVDHIDFVSIEGDVLRTIEYTGEIDDEFYIRTEALPEESFYMQLYGHLQSGRVFCRLLPVQIIPVQASVEVISTSKELSAKPGEIAYGKFLITNFGIESDFAITGNDDKAYMTDITNSIHIEHNNVGIVTATFTVPPTASPGTVSTVTVTALSLKQTESVNSAVTQFVVLPPESDHVNPSCLMDIEPSCEGFTYAGICEKQTWNVSATLGDDGSGMNQVYVKPNGTYSHVDTFIPGTIDPVQVAYSASCCQLQADIVGVDMVGNVGTCPINMGVLGGLVLDFKAIDRGTTWVFLQWSLSETIYDVHKYSLTYDVFTSEFPCKDATCTHNVTDLDPCSLQKFSLTPVFNIDEEDYNGQTEFTQETTLSLDPGSPKSGKVDQVSTNKATVSWVPKNKQCISKYKVCARPISFVDPVSCEFTEETHFELKGLESCALYHAEVTPVDLQGVLSKETLTINIDTEEGLPGKPNDLSVNIDSANTAVLHWYDPDDNAECIKRFYVQTQENDNTRITEIPVGNTDRLKKVNRVPKEHTFREDNLAPCKNFTFKVYATSKSDLLGPFAVKKSQTKEVEPSPVDTLALERVTTNSMDVAWTAGNTCVDHYKLCYHNDFEAVEECKTLKDNQFHLSNLLECVVYHVSVNTVTPSGHVGHVKEENSKTADVAPGEPQNLRVVEETPHNITIRFEEPLKNPQCALHFGTNIAKKSDDDNNNNNRKIVYVMSEYEEYTFGGLDACTDYTIKVNAAASESLSSAWVTTNGTTGIEKTSEARDLKMEAKTTTTMILKWFEPETNGKCVDTYSLKWRDGSMTLGPPQPYEVTANVDSLEPCTQYMFELTPITANGLKGPVTTLSAKTEC